MGVMHGRRMGESMYQRAGVGVGVLVTAFAAGRLFAQSEGPILPLTPDWNRAISEIDLSVNPASGLYDISIKLAFESGPTDRKERDLSVEISFLVNRLEVAMRRQVIVIQPGTDSACSEPPCSGSVCGTVGFATHAADVFCRESSSCANQPFSCDCRCGDTLMIQGPTAQKLAPGDEITVLLRPAPGALDDPFAADDAKNRTFAERAPNGSFNDDLVIDLRDYAEFNRCIDGPARGGLPPACRAADMDVNGSVDLFDFQKFQLSFNSLIEFCSASSLRFYWPLPGVDAREWVINNYLDLAPGGGLLDYMGNTGGNAKTYNGHKGIDIDVPTFRAMDNNFPVVAAAAGYVVDWYDDNFDRNTSCSTDPWNFVKVEHANGFHVWYGHLKRNSVVVDVGDWIVPGQKLGVVGSSGCSTAPHLHFEVHDCDNNPVEPFGEGMWFDPPVYQTVLGFMDAALRDGSISNVNQVMDPPPNVTLLSPNDTLGVGLSLGGGVAGNTATVTFRRPNDSVLTTWNLNFSNTLRHSIWWNSVVLGSEVGFWKAEVRTNGSLARTYTFGVSTVSPNFFQQVRFGIPAGSYQNEFNNITAAGYRPVWVDGYDVLGFTYFNAIFDRSNPGPWAAAHDMTGAEYDDFVDAYDALGYRLTNVDSYLDGGIRYAAIMVKDGGPTWVARHGQTAGSFQNSFDQFSGQGYRAVNISVVRFGGEHYFTSLYDKKNVGGWVALPDLTSSEYQSELENNVDAGRTLAYLNGYNDAGVARFSAIWNSTPYSSWVARHDRSATEFQDDFDTFAEQGFLMSIVTGYQSGFTHNFGGFWFKN